MSGEGTEIGVAAGNGRSTKIKGVLLAGIDDGNVKEFVIEQIKIDTFKIRYSSEVELSEDKKRIIETEMKRYLEDGISIIFKRELRIERSKSGKLKQFISLIKDES